MKRRTALACLATGFGLSGGARALAACAPRPAAQIEQGHRRWTMTALWARRFHDGGKVARPMGYEYDITLKTGEDWIGVDYILGDDKALLHPGGLGALEPETMREDILRGIDALGGDLTCPAEDFSRYSFNSPLGETGSIQVEIVPVSRKSAVAVRRVDRVDSGGVAFWDREVFLLRYPPLLPGS